MLLLAPWEILPFGSIITLFALIFLIFMTVKLILNEYRSKGWKMYDCWQYWLVSLIALLLFGGILWLAVAIVIELI